MTVITRSKQFDPEVDAGQFFWTRPDPTHTNSDPTRPDPRFGADE